MEFEITLGGYPLDEFPIWEVLVITLDTICKGYVDAYLKRELPFQKEFRKKYCKEGSVQ